MMIMFHRHSFLGLLLSTATFFVHATPPDSVVATVAVGINPNGLAVTPDGAFVYVANNNNIPVTNGDTVSIIDTSTNLVTYVVTSTTFDGPYTVTMNAAGTIAYVTNSNGSTVSLVSVSDDATESVVTTTIPGFDGPSGFVINPVDPTIAYVNNYGADGGAGSGNCTTTSKVNLLTNSIITTFTAGGLAPAAMAITPDGAHLYIANYVDGNSGTGTVNVVRTTDNVSTATITGFSGPFNIIINNAGTKAYVSNFGSNNFAPVGTTVNVIDLDDNTVTATISLGIQPSGLALTPDDKYLYVSNYYTLYLDPIDYEDLTAFQGTVNIIRTSDNTVILPTINVGGSPDSIAINPDGTYAYVSNYTTNNVSIIGIPQCTVTAQGCQTANVFLTQEDIIDRLTWSVSGTVLPVTYQIYRDAELTDLVATLAATQPFIFLDHNRTEDIEYTYYIVGIDAVGTTSYPVTVTVTQHC